MKLLRLAFITFEPSIKKTRWEFKIDKQIVQALRSTNEENGKKLRVFVASQTRLLKKPILEDNYVVIPEKERLDAEKAIETAANLLSITSMSKHSISSPNPCVALISTKAEEKWLNKTKGIKYKTNKTNIHFDYKFDLDKKLIKNLDDRLDGVALLSEAISTDHATGKFHEFMRLFERAFGLSSKSLISPLSTFLSSKNYSKRQIADWIYKLRHPATHADKKKHFILESDVMPEISIIQQAAYDVLFNKKTWHDSSTTRRNVFSPKAGVMPNGKGIFATERSFGQTYSFRLLDKFGSFPTDFHGILNNLPDTWWSKDAEEYTDKDLPYNRVE